MISMFRCLCSVRGQLFVSSSFDATANRVFFIWSRSHLGLPALGEGSEIIRIISRPLVNPFDPGFVVSCNCNSL